LSDNDLYNGLNTYQQIGRSCHGYVLKHDLVLMKLFVALKESDFW